MTMQRVDSPVWCSCRSIMPWKSAHMMEGYVRNKRNGQGDCLSKRGGSPSEVGAGGFSGLQPNLCYSSVLLFPSLFFSLSFIHIHSQISTTHPSHLSALWSTCGVEGSLVFHPYPLLNLYHPPFASLCFKEHLWRRRELELSTPARPQLSQCVYSPLLVLHHLHLFLTISIALIIWFRTGSSALGVSQLCRFILETVDWQHSSRHTHVSWPLVSCNITLPLRLLGDLCNW